MIPSDISKLEELIKTLVEIRDTLKIMGLHEVSLSYPVKNDLLSKLKTKVLNAESNLKKLQIYTGGSK